MLWIIVSVLVVFVVWKIFLSSGTTSREHDLVERQVREATAEHREEMREQAEGSLALLTNRGRNEALSNSDLHEINISIEVLTHLDAHEEGVGDNPAFRLRRRREYQQMAKQGILRE